MNIEINSQFQKALDLIENTKSSLFLTGRAGTGKSTFLKHLANTTKKKFVILAPTGVAALNVEGETIHSFFRFHPNMTEKDILNRAKLVAQKSIYHKLDLIIIDEISMVRSDLLDHVDLFLRKVLKTDLPFAGIQMLFIGDLYQLPPVVTDNEKELFENKYKSAYFFDAPAISDENFNLKFIELTQIYRQSDEKFIDILNSVRNNTANSEHLLNINSRHQPGFSDSDFITLTTTNNISNQINQAELDKLEDKLKKYTATVSGEISQGTYPTESELTLKAGAMVMFLNNDSQGRWVNGTIGKITDVAENHVMVEVNNSTEHKVESHNWEVIRYAYDHEKQMLTKDLVGAFKQLPLRLAWAITIHKSQGKTFDKLILDMGWGAFAHGQTYVALSRCRSLEGIVLKRKIKATDIKVDQRIVEFLKNIDVSIEQREEIFQNKVNKLKDAMNNHQMVEIVYIGSDGNKLRLKILVSSITEESYEGYQSHVVKAFVLNNPDEQIFHIDRIVDMNVSAQVQMVW